MKILHFILGRASLHTSNGVNKVIHGLCKYSNKFGHEVKVIGISGSSKKEKDLVKRDGFEVDVYQKLRGACFKAIKKAAKEVDIVHLHSVWNNKNIVVANYLIKNKIPYVITAHSGLTDDRLKQSKYWLKLAYHYGFQKRIFDRATGIHAITREEITAMSNYIKNPNIFYVPNGLDLDFPEIENPSIWNKVRPSRKKVICGYLGRLTVEKNIGGLIDAIDLLPSEVKDIFECHLIGPNKSAEAKKLKDRVNNLGLQKNIIFTGALYGDDKYRKLLDLDFYFHPAFSDVVSIAVKEAMYCGLPSVITRTSDVAYYYNTDAFVMVEPQAKDLARGVLEIIDRRNDWPLMSANAKNLVTTTFNWSTVVPKMISSYKKVLNND